MNQSDIYGQEVWVFNQLEPYQERMYMGRKEPRPVPSYAIPFPDSLIKNAPPELTELQLEERENDFLKLHGI